MRAVLPQRPSSRVSLVRLRFGRAWPSLRRFTHGNLKRMAGEAGFEPTTYRLTAGRSAAELHPKKCPVARQIWRDGPPQPHPAPAIWSVCVGANRCAAHSKRHGLQEWFLLDSTMLPARHPIPHVPRTAIRDGFRPIPKRVSAASMPWGCTLLRAWPAIVCGNRQPDSQTLQRAMITRPEGHLHYPAGRENLATANSTQ